MVISADGADDVTLHGSMSGTGRLVMSGKVKGWYGHPDIKVSTSARSMADGNYDVEDASVLYGPRTLTIQVAAVAETRADAIELAQAVDAMGHRVVDVRLVEDGSASDAVPVNGMAVDGDVLSLDAVSDPAGVGGHDTWCSGYLRTEWDDRHTQDGVLVGSVTVVCTDPHRYSTLAHVGYMTPAVRGLAGLEFGPKLSGLGGTVAAGVLGWPLTYGPAAEGASSSCTLPNLGTSIAYPTITASGSMPGGFAVTDRATGAQVAYGAPVGSQPVVIDCRTCTASVNGVDVTRYLTQRHFPRIQPGGSVSLVLTADGTGGVAVEARDTYI